MFDKNYEMNSKKENESKIIYFTQKILEKNESILKCQDLILKYTNELKLADLSLLEIYKKLQDENQPKELKNQSKTLSHIMDLRNNKKQLGIHGRLGDLGSIDCKYDIAVSTACGLLDHIVVDNIRTARACIENLKINNQGVLLIHWFR